MEIMERTHEVVAGALAKAGISRERPRGRRGHEPARDDGRVGAVDRQADLQRARLAGHANRPDLQRAVGRRRPGSVPRGDGSPDRHVLLGAEDPVDPGQRRGCPRPGGGRRTAVREHRHLGDLEHHRRSGRRGACHRRDERQPDDADGPRHPRLGRLEPRTRSVSPGRCCRRSGRPARSTARRPGDLAGIPVAGDLGDQQAALFGQTCFGVGEAKNTYGTGNFLLAEHGHEGRAVQERPDHRTGLQDRRPASVYMLEGSIAITGALVQWLRDNLGLIGSSAEVEDLARTVDDNGGVYFVPAFSGLFAPYWRSDARGVIAGPDTLRQQGPHRDARSWRRPRGRRRRSSTR